MGCFRQNKNFNRKTDTKKNMLNPIIDKKELNKRYNLIEKFFRK